MKKIYLLVFSCLYNKLNRETTQQPMMDYQIIKRFILESNTTFITVFVVAIQSLSHVWLFETLWTVARQTPLFSTIPRVCSNSLIWWCYQTISSTVAPFSFCLQSFPASGFFPVSWLFISGGQSIGASVLSSVLLLNEYSGLISLKIDWFDLLAVQGIFRNLLQHHSSKASILWHSAFFTVQLSQLYVTTGKTIALTIQTFVGRVMSLLFSTV